MEQMFRLLFVGLLGGLWLSLEEANCQDLDKGISTTSNCYNTSSGKTCFTILLANSNHLVLKPFQTARNWCNSTVPGSSLIIIDSLESQGNVEDFIERHELANETIITDAQKPPSSVRFIWSWVNGNATIPRNVSAEQLPGLDGACVESKHGQSLAYCTAVSKTQHRYICEYSDSNSSFSYPKNKSYYVASEGVATWYDARNECLRMGGDLASITDLPTIEDWSRLKERHTDKYWIGLHRNKWIWNSTGAALTYTNWEVGYPDETSSDKQCICINPQCNRTICEVDRKWRDCNCSHDYAIVCQKEEKSDAVITKIVATKEMLPSTSTTRRKSSSRSTPPTIATTTSTNTPVAPTPATPTTTASITPITPRISNVITNTTTNAEINRKTVSTSSVTQKPSNHFYEYQTTAFESSSKGLFDSFGTKETLIILLLFVAVVCIIVAVIVVIRKRKSGRQNEVSPTKNTKQSDTVSPVYATVVPVNRPSEGTASPCNTIYAEVEMTKQPTPPSNNAIYASVQPTSVQPTSEAADKGKSVDYADLDFPQKGQQKPSSADKITASLSSNYSQPYKPPTSASNTLHAEPTYLEAIDVDPRATQESQDPSALYAEPMKLKKSP